MSATFTVKNIRDLGPQFTINPHQMVGQDGAYSIPLENDDKTLWFFGDTLIGSRVPGESIWYPGGQAVGPYDMSGRGSIRRMINNCGLLTDNARGIAGLAEFQYILDNAGELKTLIPLRPDEHHDEFRVWCMHGIALNGKIYLFFIKVGMLAEGPFPVNFEILGSGIAVGSANDWRFQRIDNHGSDLFWGKDDPQFGSAALLSDDSQWVYLLGVNKDERQTQLSNLARVPAAALADRRQYEFFCGRQKMWSSDVADAKAIFNGPPNEQSLSFNQHLGCYLAVHSMDISGQIVARTAENPWGPWSDPHLITTIKPVRKKPLPYPPLVYAAKEHPVLSDNGGKTIYITYVEFEEYYPHLLEVTLA